jgi:glycosyltransferase involved in cell wall biosynthesis
MKIALLSPSIYMSPIKYGDMIFAPRDLAVSLADGLVDRGHDVYFFTTPDIKTKAKLVGGDSKLLENDYIAGSLAGQTSERLKWGYQSVLKHDFESDLTLRCFRMAQTEGFDIVHSYHERLAHFWNEFTGIPTVYTLHDPLPTTENNLFYWLLDRYKKHNYVSISNAFRLPDRIGLNFIDTVYHGIDIKKYNYSFDPGQYLSFMARLIKPKGVGDAIQAAKAANIPLSIATSERPENMSDDQYYRENVAPYVDNQNVKLVDFMSGDKKSEFFAHAKALLFPIKWEEPFGMVMIEAMACGTPVIAYNRGSVAEIVKDGVTGFIIDSDDNDSGPAARQPQIHPQGDPGSGAPRLASPEKSTRIIKKTGIAGLVEAINRIGEIDRKACRKHVEENFTNENTAAGYENVYRKITAAKPI